MCATRFFLPPSASRYRANAPTSTDLGADANLRLIPFPSSSRHGLSSISYIPSSTSRVLSSASLSPFVVASRSRRASRRRATPRTQTNPSALAPPSRSPPRRTSPPRRRTSHARPRPRPRRVETRPARRGGVRASADAAPRVHLSRLRARLARSVRARARNDGAERVPQHAAHRVRSRAAVETPAGARMRRDSECGAHFV